MPERLAKRPAGVTRLPSRHRSTGSAEVLPAVDTSGFTTPQLVAALTDRGLQTTGTTAQLAQRLSDAIAASYTASGS